MAREFFQLMAYYPHRYVSRGFNPIHFLNVVGGNRIFPYRQQPAVPVESLEPVAARVTKWLKLCRECDCERVP